MSFVKNIPVLNSLRAFAAISVCLFHYVCTVVGFVNNDYVKDVFSFGQYGVHVFFVISGFIIPWSMYHNKFVFKTDFFKFILKRLIRLEPPYIISVFVAICYAYLRHLGPNYNNIDTIPSITQIALHFGYLIPFFENQKWIRDVYWTLAIEFQYYIFIALILPLLISRLRFLRILVFSLFLLAPLYNNASFLPSHIPIFMLGILLFMYKTDNLRNKEFWSLLILTSSSVFYFHGLTIFLFSIIPFFVILYYSNFTNKYFNFLGEISYSIYLFHSLTGMVLLNYFAHQEINLYSKVLLVVAAVTIAIVFSYFIYILVERPSKRLSSKISYSKK